MLDSGNVIIRSGQKIVVLSNELNKEFEVLAENMIDDIAVTKNNQVVVGFLLEKAQIQILDFDKKKLGDMVQLDIEGFQTENFLLDGLEYDFYYRDLNGIYGYNFDIGKTTQIMDYVESNLSNMDICDIIPLSNEQLLATIYDDQYNTQLVLYEKKESSIDEDKQTITVGCLYVDDYIKAEAVKFNKKNDEYQIVFRDYSSEEDPIEKMNIDFMTGNTPDVLDLTDLPVQRYVAMDMLEDLTPYFEADSDLGLDDLIDSVRNAMETDGKVYYISPSFSIKTLIGRTEDVGTEFGWTFDDFKMLLEKKGGDSRPFDSSDKNSMLNTLLYSSVGDFVDWNTGQCSFESQDFKNILEICNMGTELDESDDDQSYPRMVKDNKILFVDGYVTMEEMQLYEKIFGTDIIAIGYPNEEKEGSYFVFNNRLAICSKSDVKNGAWQFIRSFMTKEYQGKQNAINNPVRKDCMDMMIKAYTTTTAYTDELGNEITPLDRFCGLEDLQIQLSPLSNEQVTSYMDLVNNTTRIEECDEAIIEIIEIEAKSYFAGDKSVDEVAEIIQNRVETYLNENR